MSTSARRAGSRLVVAIFFVCGGCKSPGTPAEELQRPTARAEFPAGVTDRSLAFAAIFCRNYRAFAKQKMPCDRWLYSAPSASIETPALAQIPVRKVRDIVIIPGIFGECVNPWVTPYSADYPYLEARGYRVWVVPVTGRGSATVNARIIHDFFATHNIEHAAVIGYSKGATDFMSAAAQPQARLWSGRIVAFVAISGVVNGTPLAAQAEKYYRILLEKLPFDRCPPSDGNGTQSLTYQLASATAQAFLRAKTPYPSYSLTAVATSSTVNPVLRLSYEMLKNLDWRNDGQVLVKDAIVLGSTFLGSFNADHWSIALPFEESKAVPMLALGTKNHFPRRALMLSILDFVNMDSRPEQE